MLVPARRKRQSTGFVVVHQTRRLPLQVCYLGPVQYALPARAVADAARGLDGLADVRSVVAAAVQNRRCTVEQLIEELRNGPIRGSALLRTALAEVAEGVRSGREAELRELVKRSGLPMPLFNPRLYCGDDLLAIPDVWWPAAGVVVEVDSKEWHLTPDRWERTMRRHAAMTAIGILVLHFSPRQIRDEPQEVVRAIRLAIESRHGQPSLPVRTVTIAA